MAYEEHIRESGSDAARCAIITLSDTRTAETDESGKRIRALLEAEQHAVVYYQVIPDEADALHALLTELLWRGGIDVVITNGGTGISRRDRTIEVVERHLEQTLAGFGELFRMLSWQEIGSGAMLSRATGGVARGKLLFVLPGLRNAVELAMTRLLVPEIRHLLHELRK